MPSVSLSHHCLVTPPPQETLHDPQVGLVQAPARSLLCSGSQGTGNHLCTIQAWSLSPPVLRSSCTPTLLISKARCWAASLHCQTLSFWSLEVGLGPSYGRPSCDTIDSDLWVSQLAGMGFDYIVRVPLLPSHSFFIFGCKTFLVGSVFCQ